MSARRPAIAVAGLIYFAVVFAVGFTLGPLRVLFLEPRVGVRAAELMEAPIMLCAIVVAGRWVARRLCAGAAPGRLAAVGAIAAALVLGADVAVGVGLRGMAPGEVFTARDPVAGTVYYALVALMALMPLAWARRNRF